MDLRSPILSDMTLGDFAKRVLLVLLFGAVLIAVGLDAASRGLQRATGLGNAAALSIVVGLLLACIAAALWFFGSVAARQLGELGQQIPAGVKLLLGWLEADPFGRYVLEQIRGVDAAGTAGWAASLLAGLAGSVTRGLAYGSLLFFVAIYLAAQPARYRALCIRLAPPASRPWIERLFDRTADVLRRWLLGQLVVMLTIGTLSGIGLWALGIDAALALGLVGGLLSFVPYVGAVMAAVPATLVALTQGPWHALSVVLMYAGVHFIEGNFVTPLVQAEATELPPVISLLSTVAVGVLFGPAGVLLAAPLTLFLMLAVEVLYLEQALGEPPADRMPSRKP